MAAESFSPRRELGSSAKRREVPKAWRRSFASQRARAYELWRKENGRYWEPNDCDLFYAGFDAAWVSQRQIIDALMDDNERRAKAEGRA